MKLTKKEKQLINKFDQDTSTLVISHWPVGKKFDGVATYTRDLVTKFSDKYNHKFVVMVPYEWKGSRVKEISENILLVGVFDERRVHLYPQILGWLARFGKVRRVVVHSEFCASGGLYLRVMVAPFLALIKLAGKHVTYYAHNVADDLGSYQEHLGLSGGVKMEVLRRGYRLYLRLLGLVVDKFVVLEESVAERLESIIGNSTELVVAPHWVEKKKKSMTKKKARKMLGIADSTKLVVSFGFLSWYKGSDVAVEAVQDLSSSYKLVLAGGRAVSLEDKSYYQKYYDKLVKNVEKTKKQVEITGFLTDKKIEMWLMAADLMILPYRLSMGGSGVLQQALLHRKSVLLSSAVAEGVGVEWENGFISGDPESLTGSIRKYFENTKVRKEVMKQSRKLADSRSMEKLLDAHYAQVYFVKEEDMGVLEWISEEIKKLVTTRIDWAVGVLGRTS